MAGKSKQLEKTTHQHCKTKQKHTKNNKINKNKKKIKWLLHKPPAVTSAKLAGLDYSKQTKLVKTCTIFF